MGTNTYFMILNFMKKRQKQKWDFFQSCKRQSTLSFLSPEEQLALLLLSSLNYRLVFILLPVQNEIEESLQHLFGPFQESYLIFGSPAFFFV